MKTKDGWIRGRQCGKGAPADGFAPTFVCALCGRCGVSELDLCYPVKR